MLKLSYTNSEGEVTNVELPLTWRDVTWSKFVEYEGKEFKTALDRVFFMSGIPEIILLNNPLFLKGVIDACSFVLDREALAEYENHVSKEYVALIEEKKISNIGSLPWGKIETAKALIKANENNVNAAANGIIKEYLGVEINDKSCVEVIGLVAFFFAKIGEFFERYQELNNSPIDEDEEQAGVQRLAAFGPFATMDSLTGGDLSKHDEYWNMPADKIYTKLLFNKVSRDIQKDLETIKKAKANVSTK